MEQGCVLPAKAKARTGTATATSYALHATAICIAKNVMAEKATTPQNTDNQNVNSTILPLSPRIKHLGTMGEHYFFTGEFQIKMLIEAYQMDGSYDMFQNALIHCCLHRNMPKACPYAMMQPLFALFG